MTKYTMLTVALMRLGCSGVPEQRWHAMQRSNGDPAGVQKAIEALKVCSPARLPT